MLLFLSYSVMPEYFWSHGLQHTRLHYLLDFAQTHVHWVDDAIQPSHLLSPPSPPAFNLPASRSFSMNQSALCIRRAKLWGFSFSIRSSTEYSGLISFRVDWFDLLPVQGTLNSFLQHHSWKASNLWCSVFFYGLTLTSVRDYWKKHPFIYLPYIKCYLCIAAAAAKSLQSCLTLCDPIDGSPPGSPNPGILQARTIWETEEQRNPCLSSTQMWKEIHTYTETSHN